jgi:hypothetical protein
MLSGSSPITMVVQVNMQYAASLRNIFTKLIKRVHREA